MPHPNTPHDPQQQRGCTTTINLVLPLSVVVVSLAVLITVLFAPQQPAASRGNPATLPTQPVAIVPRNAPSAPPQPDQFNQSAANQVLQQATIYPSPTAYPYPYLTPSITASPSATATFTPTNTRTPLPNDEGPSGPGGIFERTSIAATEAAIRQEQLATEQAIAATATATAAELEPEEQFFTCIPGTTVEIAGSGAPANTDLIIFMNGRAIGGGRSDSNGRYRILITIGPERPDIYLLEIKTRERRILIREAACDVPAPTPPLLPNAPRAP
jgi:hypothetical protein